ncbi:MAG: DUF1330 domain-containing protein [Rhodobacteraceae bacterium]|nr:DUF1330 domain-containing protein [Paracoccaceae bacterium]
MSALWISHATVTDHEAYGRYARLAKDVIHAHGGEFLVRSGAHRQMEGTDRPRNVVVRFASLEAAVGCYESPEYQAALAHADHAAERSLVIVEEL